MTSGTTSIDRRRFLAGGAAAAGVLALPGARAFALGGDGPAAIPSDPFTLGVASGDPLPASVILWTRLAPDPVNGGGMAPDDVVVAWQVASDAAFTQVVASGNATAVAAHGHSLHVDATGLSPDTAYHYRFQVEGYTSPTGRTRTTPLPGATPASLRFGFASCQSYTSGYYTAHHHLAAEDLDLVFWLGDFIYENGGSGVRAHNGGEIFTLDDYRNRYGLYIGDTDLQASRAAFPWVVIWDDHEVDNDYAGDQQEDGAPVDQFRLRRAAAYQAWWEHQPVRLPAPTGPDYPIYRSLQWGTLANAFAIDGRQYRSDQACGDALISKCDDQYDPARTMLGAEQEAWLFAGLRASATTWNVIANQTVFAALPLAGNYNQDQWDGYQADRQRVIDVLAEPSVQNTMIITGDIHAAGIADVHRSPEDATSPRVATELVGTSISSTFPAVQAPIVEQLVSALPWSHYVNARDRGYTVVELTPTNAHAEYRVVSTTAEAQATVRTDFSYDVAADPAVVAPPPPVVTPRFTG